MYESHARARIEEIDREIRQLGLTAFGPRLDRPDNHRDRARLRRLLRAMIRVRPADPTTTETSQQVLLRVVDRDDGQLARLARLDERRAPTSAAIVAQIDNRMVAAVPLDDGPIVADPFSSVGDLVELLELRRRQLKAARRTNPRSDRAA